MYRVLLPEGELTVTSSIEFLVEQGGSVLRSESFKTSSDTDFAVFIHCKMPFTKHNGVLIGGLSADKVSEIKNKLLTEGYYDFSCFDFDNHAISAEDLIDDRQYYCLFTDSSFESLKNLINE